MSAIGCAPQARDPEVVVDGTTLVGAHFGAPNEVVFRGVPYASPPVGALRFQPPQPLAAHPGRLDATEFSPACIQPTGEDGNIAWYWDVADGFGVERSVVPDEPSWSEDCLYLNVWSTTWNGSKLAPVMVWIHGGSNHTGWSFEPPYRGEELARRGVVVVSINYRLGELGFLAHPDLSAESEHGSSGNYGLLDQIAALEWVREHIDAFGGDPNRVTIFGESAGGADVGYLLVSPLAKGLFHRAISQSGGYQISDFRDLAEEEATGQKLASSAAELRAMSSAELLSRASELGVTGRYGPNIDGWVIPHAPARAEHHSVPLLIGANADEWSMYVPETMDHDAFTDRLRSHYGAYATRALELYRDGSFERWHTNEVFTCPSKLIARSMASAGTRTYLYDFTRRLPRSGRLGAYHGAEIPYVFGTPEAWHDWEAVDHDLSNAMMGYWVRFAETGDPNAEGRPPWPAYGDDDRYLELGDAIRARKGLEAEACRLYETKLTEDSTSCGS